MKKHWLTYSASWKESPLAFWVHIPIAGDFYSDAAEFQPKAPLKEFEGYAIYHFEVDGFVFNFSSREQIEHFLDVLSQKVLPSSKELSAKRGSGLGPNRHWLSRMPAKAKSAKYREKLIKYIKEQIKDY